jgi:hypothetical protein
VTALREERSTVHDTIDGLEEIRALAGQFAADRLRPNVERWDHDRAIDAEVLDELGQLGFHGMLAPESHGGLAFGAPTFAAVVEQLAWGETAVAFRLLASGIAATALGSATDDAKTRWLEGLAAGSVTGAIPLSRRDGLRALRQGDGWTVDGSIGWVLRGETSLLVADAATDQGRAVFCVPLDSAGITVTRREDTLGLRSATIESLELKGVALPDSARLASTSSALQVVECTGTAAIAAGIARAALEYAIAYADEREQFGRRIRQFQGVRMKLADMKVRVDAAAAMVREAAVAGSHAAAAGSRVFASESAMWVTTQAVQIFGGYGYMRDYPVEKLMRDAKATELLAQTNETLRETVAAALYPN